MKTVTEFIGERLTYDNEGQYFFGYQKDGTLQVVGELRGWGAIQNLFKDKKGLIDMDAAAKFQDELGEWIAGAVNDKLKTESEQLKISSKPVLADVSNQRELLIAFLRKQNKLHYVTIYENDFEFADKLLKAIYSC
jgi:hypothetical protein